MDVAAVENGYQVILYAREQECRSIVGRNVQERRIFRGIVTIDDKRRESVVGGQPVRRVARHHLQVCRSDISHNRCIVAVARNALAVPPRF